MDSFVAVSSVFVQGREDKVDGVKLITWAPKKANWMWSTQSDQKKLFVTFRVIILPSDFIKTPQLAVSLTPLYHTPGSVHLNECTFL